MPTHEEWLSPSIFVTKWESPLSSEELRLAFGAIYDALEESENGAHVMFDLTQSGMIPFNAPYLALKSGFMTHPHAGRVAVVGMNIRAEILADIVVKVTRRDILFFPTYDKAREYLQDEVVVPTDNNSP